MAFNPSSAFLDQARDPFAHAFAPTVDQYDDYLRGEYSQNQRERLQFWEEHYQHMRRATAEAILHLLENGAYGRRTKRKDMNIALVGPGFDPVGKELIHDFVDQYLAPANNIVVIDFSERVLVSAKQSLIRAGVHPNKILPMQFDITNGVSTVYRQYLQTVLGNMQGETEEDLWRATEPFDRFNVQELDDGVGDNFLQAARNPVRPLSESEIGGGLNAERTLQLTINHEPLPLHLMAYQMIVAGTGAAAEDLFWSRYHETLNHTRMSRREVTEVHMQERRKILRRFFSKIVCPYNTQIALRAGRAAICDNPDALVSIVTDTTTIMQDTRDTYRRLDIGALTEAWGSPPSSSEIPPIEVNRPFAKWNWPDEVEHGHEVGNFELQRASGAP